MDIREGSRVAYVGPGDHGLEPGDRGKVVSSDGDASHVLWSTGVQAGSILFHDNYDIVVQGRQDYDEDLYGAPLVSTAVAETFDRYGPTGLLNALNEEGHLAVFAPIAEEAFAAVVSRIRTEPAFLEVIAQLGDEDGEEVISLAALALLRDAFGGEEL